MIFNSLQYALFLPLVLAIYWQLRRRGQNLLLLVASYIFYGAWDWRFLSLLLISTVLDYTVGRRLDVTDDQGRRRMLLAASVVGNLGILASFKYFNFFVGSATTLLENIGLAPSTPLLQVVLPVGISFYTFQTMSYAIDVYRRELQAERDLAKFALFVAYFPQLVAGPIERATNLLPQFDRRRAIPSTDRLASGGLLILLGLFKKVAIADALAPMVDEAFADPSAGWITLVVGVYAFALQIYADFSGYTDIARGSSRLMGIEVMENFAQPYLSRNMTAFWRTWHISLSSWLRDYLYIPLGGNRSGGSRTTRNLMLTMLLGGLWHGAAWTFVVWGGLHGLFLAADHFIRGHRSSLPGAQRKAVVVDGAFHWRDLLPAFVTFNLVCLAWIFFRAPTLAQALEYLGGIVTLRAGAIEADLLYLFVPAAIATFAIDLVQRQARDHTVMLSWPAPVRGAFYAACCLGVLLFSGTAPVPFIYFQF